jgi:hypothetical protein
VFVNKFAECDSQGDHVLGENMNVKLEDQLRGALRVKGCHLLMPRFPSTHIGVATSGVVPSFTRRAA